MMQKIFYSGVALLILGNFGRIYAMQYQHVTADGILHDSIWLPISAIMLLVGVLLLAVSGAMFVANRLRTH